MDNRHIIKCIQIMCNAILDIYDLIGSGKKEKIDYLASIRFDDLLNIFNNIKLLSFEGERDGVKISILQNMNENDICDVQIALDPIDGTTTCSLGGSRGLSAIAVNSYVTKKYKRVPDSLSCFYIASNTDKNFLNILYLIGNKKNEIHEYMKNIKSVSSIRRQESELLWGYLVSEKYCQEQGENTYYMPSLKSGPLFCAGDSSISLFLESNYFIGRTGASEAMIEARLWRYWKGILVSGTKIKTFEGGIVEYIRRRVQASYHPEKFALEEFFLESELSELFRNGWSKNDILHIFNDDFAPDYDFILIGSITGTEDKILKEHSLNNLKSAYLNRKTQILELPVWIKTENYKGMAECYYNIVTGDLEWKKKNTSDTVEI